MVETDVPRRTGKEKASKHLIDYYKIGYNIKYIFSVDSLWVTQS